MRKTLSKNPRETLKLFFTILTLLAVGAIFALNQTLFIPTVLSIVISILGSPLVRRLESAGFKRKTAAQLTVFSALLATGLFGFWSIQSVQSDWNSLAQELPVYFEAGIEKIKKMESDLKQTTPFLGSLNVSEDLSAWGQQTSRWAFEKIPMFIGDLFTWLLLIPFFCFVFLKDGHLIQKSSLKLLPIDFLNQVISFPQKFSHAFLTIYEQK